MTADRWIGAAAVVIVGVWVLIKAQYPHTDNADAGGADPTVGTTDGLRALAAAIATAEGFGLPGALPTRANNPGDLMRGNVGLGTIGGITVFRSVADGWAALHAQLRAIAQGTSAYYTPTMTIAELAARYTATEVDAWTSNVVAALRAKGYDVDADTPIAVVLT